VQACVTQAGGHLGPVTFDRQGKKIQPYSIAPWAEEKIDPSLPTILKVLRGDFFCMPFGGNGKAFRGEKHPVHGETANASWKFEAIEVDGGKQTLHLSLDSKTRPGRVDKRITVADGQDVVYSEHTISGMKGPMSPGHHAMLQFPEEPGSGIISTSPFVYGQVLPDAFEVPANKGYQCLKPGAVFTSLSEVPTLTGDLADLSRYPARRGFEDLVILVADQEIPFGWTAVAFPKQRYVWFALKNQHVLRQTVFWISNAGRHYAPWNGRHACRMGLEEVTSYYHYGLAESAAKNGLSEKGYPTCIQMNPKVPLVIPYIMGVAAIPAGFDKVTAIEATEQKDGIVIASASGKRVKAAVDLAFLGMEG
jgi:hypothetical protein